MADKKKPFINPLTRSSEEKLHLPELDEKVELNEQESRKQKKEAFESTHQRFTGWVDKELKKKFDALVKERGVSKAALLNEAITLLLHKQERKPYTRKQSDAEYDR